MVSHQSTNASQFMETEVLSPCSQQSVAGPYSDIDTFSPRLSFVLIWYPFSIILASMPGSSKWTWFDSKHFCNWIVCNN
jgi:hypothetical protein